jgi:hypothetical protein
MHQTILSAKKVDSRIVQELNDTKKNSELTLFDRVKKVNQEDRTCIEIKKVLQENKKSYDEMLLKRFNQSKIFYSSRKSYEYSNQIS